MILMLLKCVLINLVFHTGAQKTLQPYGPKMCEILCQETKACLDYTFDNEQLRCRVVANDFTSIQSSREKEKDGFDIADNNSLLKTTTTKQPDVKSSTDDSTDTPCPPTVVRSLAKACECGDLDEVKRLLSLSSADVNCQDDHGMTALMVNVGYQKRNIILFDFLMQQKPDLSALNSLNQNVLHCACLAGGTNIVRSLLDDHKMDIEFKDGDEHTPLMLAVQQGQIEVARVLNERGADVASVDKNNDNILHLACKYTCINSNVDTVKYVLSLNKLDVDGKGNKGRTPLMMGVAADEITLVRLLYTQHHASLTALDNEGQTVLHLACIYCDNVMMSYLVTLPELKDFGKKKDKHGRTPVRLAIKYRKRYMIPFLKLVL